MSAIVAAHPSDLPKLAQVAVVLESMSAIKAILHSVDRVAASSENPIGVAEIEALAKARQIALSAGFGRPTSHLSTSKGSREAPATH